MNQTTTAGVPTVFDFIAAHRQGPEAIAKLARGRVAPEPKPATVATAAPQPPREAEGRQGGLGL